MDKLPPKTILIDFDGTVAGNSYPDIGPDVPHAVSVLQRLNKAGHTLILCTMRYDNLLDDAEAWFRQRDIDIKYKNCNPEFETGSRKIFGNFSVDDHNLMTPLEFDPDLHHKPYVDWVALEKEMERIGLL